MIKVIENYNLNSKKKRISESIDGIGNIFQILQAALPKIFWSLRKKVCKFEAFCGRI